MTFEKRFELGPRHNTYLWDVEDPLQTGTQHLSIDCSIWDPVGPLYVWRNWPKEGEVPVRSYSQLAACGRVYGLMTGTTPPSDPTFLLAWNLLIFMAFNTSTKVALTNI